MTELSQEQIDKQIAWEHDKQYADADLSEWKGQKLKEFQDKLFALEQYRENNKLRFSFPKEDEEGYKKHLEFFEAGSWARFRMLAGGNGSGKSYTAAEETTLHATGLYDVFPCGWKGKRLRKPTTIWIVAESMPLFRDSFQQLLLGKSAEEEGTGLIPKECIVKTEAYSGVTGSIGRILVRHVLGHIVTIVVKTFEMNRRNLQAATIDLLVCDEEPPEEIYTECVLRTRGTKTKEPGIVILAFTSFQGMTGVVKQFVPNGQFSEDGRVRDKPNYYVQRISWKDAPHLSLQDREEMMTAIPLNQRASRVDGYIALGAGQVYPVHEKDIRCDFVKIAPHWPRAYGMDFGWNCTAVIWGAKDPDTDIIYLYGEYYKGQLIPEVHALAIKQRGPWIPGVCDPRGDKRSEADGTQLLSKYRDAGLELTAGNNAIQSGIANILGRMETGTLKIAYSLENWWDEFRGYQYDKTDPNKIALNQKDHLMDATRYLLSKFDQIARSPLDVQAEEKLQKQRKPHSSSEHNEVTGY